ncbi:MAG: hypothetical protein KME45_24160 [Stenomitos rutilans HA7619-LM2]|nr:hypothetical protein [Stenomitos rutilans HA7619-LM2]
MIQQRQKVQWAIARLNRFIIAFSKRMTVAVYTEWGMGSGEWGKANGRGSELFWTLAAIV